MANRTAAEVFPPGEFLREELEARGWTVEDFASMLGYPIASVEGLIEGGSRISPEVAARIGEVLGTGPTLWLNLERAYHDAAGSPVRTS